MSNLGTTKPKNEESASGIASFQTSLTDKAIMSLTLLHMNNNDNVRLSAGITIKPNVIEPWLRTWERTMLFQAYAKVLSFSQTDKRVQTGLEKYELKVKGVGEVGGWRSKRVPFKPPFSQPPHVQAFLGAMDIGMGMLRAKVVVEKIDKDGFELGWGTWDSRRYGTSLFMLYANRVQTPLYTGWRCTGLRMTQMTGASDLGTLRVNTIP
jgi:hypothetical protein